MIDVVTHENRDQYQDMLDQMFRQRKQVFIDQLGWDLPATGDMEIDQYDDDRSTYLLASDDGRNVTGSIRILPTVTPHLMSDLFEGFCAAGVPVSENIWEVSRIYTMTPTLRPKDRIRAAAEIMSGVCEYAMLYGVEEVTMVSYMANMPIIIGLGYDVTPLGLPIEYKDGNTYVASTMRMNPAGLQNARDMHGLPSPVLSTIRTKVAA